MTRQFHSIREEAMLNLFRTARSLEDGLAVLLKQRTISMSQYNVLRILVGSHPEGMMCSEIANRMINRDPDMTRLLDRMEKQGWITRTRDTVDRRSVLVNVTNEGIELTKEMKKPIQDYVDQQFPGISQKDLKLLIDILEKSR